MTPPCSFRQRLTVTTRDGLAHTGTRAEHKDDWLMLLHEDEDGDRHAVAIPYDFVAFVSWKMDSGKDGAS